MSATSRHRRGLGASTLLLALALALTGCAVIEEFPRLPGPPVTDFVPTDPPQPSPDGSLSPDGFDTVERMAVRIRNIGCSSLSTGSGFAIDATTLITNRHVVADSADLQVSTYDGRDIDVTATSTASLADLAVVRTAEELPSFPELAPADPVRGDAVTVVGYPQGGVLTATRGQVIGSTTDPLNEILGEVLVTDAPVEPGSSGSAVLDEDGRVVGVVYAKNATGQSFIVPVSTLRSLLADEGAFTPSAGCDQ
ncbi:serine protease [Actinotalea sp. K2]|uniref:S1C family serine protease n=1 Tax=Actinotalea sp. K2 TaxID=2939438 RepID=UPI0020182AC7|nr:serine protease [Actinotalea sp. K2]MCL3860096.1 serine protease [Actinotalea sp. K2]